MSQAFNIPAPVTRGALGFVLLIGLFSLPAAARAQDPVQDLRRELVTRPYVDLLLAPEKRQDALKKAYDERDRTVGKIIERLKSFPQLRQALLLKEWGDVAKNDREDVEALTSDARLRAKIAQRYRAKVNAVVERGDNDSKAAIANLITELGLTVRSTVDPAKLINLDRLSKNDKRTADEDAELDRLVVELDNDRRPGFARSLTEDIIRLSDADNQFVKLHALRALAGTNPDPKRAAPAFGAKLTSSPDVQIRRIAADGLLRLVSIAEYLEDTTLRLKQRPVWTYKVEVLNTCAEVVKQAPKGLTDADAGVRTASTETIKACAQVLLVQFQRPPEDKKLEDKKDQGAPPPRGFSPAEIQAIKDILKAFDNAGPRLVDALKDANVEVRLGVVQTLERLSDIRFRLAEESVNVGIFDKAGKREFLVPPQASDPLSIFAKGEWRAVARLLDDPEMRIRRSAVYFLEFFPEARPGAVPELTKALSDPDRFVRWGAARSLGTFSKDYRPQDAAQAVPALAKLLFDSDFAVRLAAAATLESLGVHAEAAAPELVRAVTFGDVENRVASLYVVQSVGPERMKAAIASVTEAAEHVDPRVRRAATETLGKFGAIAHNKNTIDVLRRALGDDDQEVRINASEALLQILDPDSPGKD